MTITLFIPNKTGDYVYQKGIGCVKFDPAEYKQGATVERCDIFFCNVPETHDTLLISSTLDNREQSGCQRIKLPAKKCLCKWTGWIGTYRVDTREKTEQPPVEGWLPIKGTEEWF